ncbi:hypothetical protein TSUD_270830 [Trifolium subterraneum]|uniref:RNase H type-1 domain-containing protein n=1 Tax=Trifolium subterraneum TaxID=3900 RepID=A0A2Z6MIK0_TRISU|nr:hypothetical protein TSUD_270830 [Trifolium subterraneum]
MVGRSKKETFAFIKDRIWKRINSWRSRHLSRAGKEIMIKSVLQAIPAYVMSIYLLPDSLIDDIERMINAFWWGGGDNNKGIRWLAWKKMACPKEKGGLGFRDFHRFNMAMVAKQGWNFINNPNSLVARIFKARWSIGDGSNIKVMGEPWLRVEDGSWVASPQHQGVYNLSLQQLMIHNSKQWDVEKINELFSAKDAHMILAVPLLQTVENDRLIWRAESDGIYSVRSGYQKLLEESNSYHKPREGDAWSALWKVQAPPKVKHLLWRICKECLPTRVRLRNRYVQCPVECPFCLSKPEEDWHMFFGCEGSKNAWYENKQVAGKTATLLWYIWQNRNNKVWNDTKINAQQVGLQVTHMWHEWAAVQGIICAQQNQEQQLQTDRAVMQWQQPQFGYFKCNVDASFYDIEGATGWGWYVRDHRGRFVIAGTNIMHQRLNTLEGEAMAIKEAMEEMVQRGFSHVIFESDSKIVVDAITLSHRGISDFSLLISSIKSILVLNPNFEVKFVKRQANMIAHSLARVAYSMSSRCKKKGRFYGAGNLAATYRKGGVTLNMKIADGEGTSRPPSLTPKIQEMIRKIAQNEALMQQMLLKQQTFEEQLQQEQVRSQKLQQELLQWRSNSRLTPVAEDLEDDILPLSKKCSYLMAILTTLFVRCAPGKFHRGITPGKLFATRCIASTPAPGKFPVGDVSLSKGDREFSVGSGSGVAGSASSVLD